MMKNFSEPEELDRDAIWAARAMETARRIGHADLLSAAYDAAGAVEIGRDRMARVAGAGEGAARASRTESRPASVPTPGSPRRGPRPSWAELEAAVDSAERARAGLVPGRASSFVLGATCWRVVALQALGRWDEALVDANRAERAWQDSELRAPWYAINGFLAALAIARARDDSVAIAHWSEMVTRIEDGPTRRSGLDA